MDLKKLGGLAALVTQAFIFTTHSSVAADGNCYRNTCAVWVDIKKSEQRLNLYVKGENVFSWDVSTGMRGYTTPNFNQHPNGRTHISYTSKKYPREGHYKGLGNMPYSVFIRGGYAIHGTGNLKNLGKRASHGCIRSPPDKAKILMELVRKHGSKNVWITVR